MRTTFIIYVYVYYDPKYEKIINYKKKFLCAVPVPYFLWQRQYLRIEKYETVFDCFLVLFSFKNIKTVFEHIPTYQCTFGAKKLFILNVNVNSRNGLIWKQIFLLYLKLKLTHFMSNLCASCVICHSKLTLCRICVLRLYMSL